MDVEVRRGASGDVGFVALPLHLIYMLQQGSAALPALVVLELSPADRRRDGAVALVPWFVAWAGASSNTAYIEVPEILADCIGLPDGRVNVRVRIDVPDAQIIQVEPATEDDCEILELNAGYLENHILNKVGVVQEGCRFPVSVPGQGIVVLLAKSTSPRPLVKLVRGTELIVALKRRQSKSSVTPETPRDIWLRVQDLDSSLHQICKLGNRTVTVIPTAAIYISPITARRVQLHNGQSVVLQRSPLDKVSPRQYQDEAVMSEEKLLEKGKLNRTAIVRLVFWDGVAQGHVMVSRSLRLFVGARVHAGVYVQPYVDTCLQFATHAKISPTLFHPVEDSSSGKLDAGSEKELLKQDMGHNDQQWWRHKELIVSDRVEKSNDGAVFSKDAASILLKTWMEAQIRSYFDSRHDEATLVPSPAKAVLCFVEVAGGNDRQTREVNFLLSLESIEQEERKHPAGFCLNIDKLQADDAPKETYSSKKSANTLEVQFGRPQYLHLLSRDNDGETEMPSIESVWMKGMAEDALSRLKTLVSPVTRQKLRTTELPTPGGVLLCGPTVCGKTQLALALAQELSQDKQILAHWVFLKCAEVAGESDTSAKRALREAVLEAADHAPCVVILDDLDALISATGGVPDSAVTALAEYLSDLMDDAQAAAPVAFLATASGPKNLPAPLRASGKFDYTIELAPPGARERAGILKEVISGRGLLCSDDVASTVAVNCDGYDANDLEIVVDRTVHASAARFLAHKVNKVTGHSRRTKFELMPEDFDSALEGFVPAALKGVAKGGSAGLKLGWDDIGGLPEVRRVLQELLELPVKYPKLFSNAPLRLRTGVLLYGPPGCGKTHIVAAAAAACSLRFIPVKGPELLDKYIGASEKAVRDIFSKAAAAAPCILFFDEFDAIAPKRGHDNTGVTDRVVNQLLAELDGVSALNGVFMFAATNRPDLIDAALLRPGRLDHLLFCNFPSTSERLDILHVLARHLPMAKDIDLEYLAHRSEGFSGADLKAVLSDAELEAVHFAIERSGRGNGEPPLITMDMLKSALAKAIPLQETERRRFASIYDSFTSSRSSSKDLKGKKATLA